MGQTVESVARSRSGFMQLFDKVHLSIILLWHCLSDSWVFSPSHSLNPLKAVGIEGQDGRVVNK